MAASHQQGGSANGHYYASTPGIHPQSTYSHGSRPLDHMASSYSHYPLEDPSKGVPVKGYSHPIHGVGVPDGQPLDRRLF